MLQTSDHSEPGVHHHFVESDWQRIQDEPQFTELLRQKRRFVLPATIFFIVYYFSLPFLVGYYPHFMSRKVVGSVSLAYLFALSQFAMAWLVMGLYLYRARRFDELERKLVEHVGSEYK